MKDGRFKLKPFAFRQPGPTRIARAFMTLPDWTVAPIELEPQEPIARAPPRSRWAWWWGLAKLIGKCLLLVLWDLCYLVLFILAVQALRGLLYNNRGMGCGRIRRH